MVSASSLLLPAAVRDLASCVSDGAVRVACTTPASTRITSSSSSSSPASPTSPSTLSVAVTYLVWSRAAAGGPPALSVAASSLSPASAVFLRKRRGSRSVPGPPPLALFWDLAAARYGASPEPVSGFYLVAVAAAEVVLAVGDLAAGFVEAKLAGRVPAPRPVARTHRVLATASARAVHTARVRFTDGGADHEVAVGCCCCSSDSSDELWVTVDGKRAVTARGLRWNFRGNQTVFVDGAPVDVMWDLHGWCFRDPPGTALVMLRARTALETRLWLDEEAPAPGFALLVQAFKSPP